jgi:nitroreductase/FMN reductase [NAD(P)H]
VLGFIVAWLIERREKMSSKPESHREVTASLQRRFGDYGVGDVPDAAALTTAAAHRSHRVYTDQPVDPALVHLLCATALSAPTKSDLQQRDIIVLDDTAQRRRITDLLEEYPWAASAPVFLVFCGNNRRQRQIHQWRGRTFANDHLDAFFNAAVDAGIALGAFVAAAETLGLGCCPISAVRNHAQKVSDILTLPDHVFPVAGLTLGWPAKTGEIVPRLPLAVTVHRDRFDDREARLQIDAYDRRRAALQPYAQQRLTSTLGTAAEYGWSEDKARQYSVPERAGFGAFIRAKGFRLD